MTKRTQFDSQDKAALAKIDNFTFSDINGDAAILPARWRYSRPP